MLTHSQWRGNTGGTTWMQRLLPGLIRFSGVWPIYIFMGVFVIPFYMLFNHKGYSAIYSYMREAHHFKPFKAFRWTYLNHFRFGQIIIDRFACYGRRKFKFTLSGNEEFLSLIGGKSGFLVLSSHIGNYEMAGYSFQATNKKFNALVFSGESKEVMKNRERILSENNINMIEVKDDMSHIFLMNSALESGDIVSVPADRIFGSPKSLECTFFGRKAKFPLGPFALACSKDVPVIALFVMKEDGKNYTVYVRRLPEPEGAKISDRASCLAQSFALEVETVLKKYPEQWFNYFNFWKNDGAES